MRPLGIIGPIDPSDPQATEQLKEALGQLLGFAGPKFTSNISESCPAAKALQLFALKFTEQYLMVVSNTALAQLENLGPDDPASYTMAFEVNAQMTATTVMAKAIFELEKDFEGTPELMPMQMHDIISEAVPELRCENFTASRAEPGSDEQAPELGEKDPLTRLWHLPDNGPWVYRETEHGMWQCLHQWTGETKGSWGFQSSAAIECRELGDAWKAKHGTNTAPSAIHQGSGRA